MLSDDVDLLSAFIGKADEWRSLGESVGVELFQMNARFPDGSAVVLKWEPSAVDNGDGTYSGDWIVSA